MAVRRYKPVNYPVAAAGSVAWGTVTGTLADQTDLQSALDLKADTTDLSAYLPLTGGTVTGATTFDNGVVLDDPSAFANDWTIYVHPTESYLQIESDDATAASEYGIDIRGGGFVTIQAPTDQLTSTPAVKADTTSGYIAMKSGSNYNGQLGFYWGSTMEVGNYIRGGLTQLVTTTAAGASGAQLELDPDGAASISSALAVTGAVTGSNLNVSNWDTAYGWGDHSTEGYLTATSPQQYVIYQDLTASSNEDNWLIKNEIGTIKLATATDAAPSSVATEVITCTRVGTTPGTLTLNATTACTGSLSVTGAVTGSNLNISNWDTAYGWGDHASGGYADDAATTAALALKAPLASPSFTGTITAGGLINSIGTGSRGGTFRSTDGSSYLEMHGPTAVYIDFSLDGTGATDFGGRLRYYNGYFAFDGVSQIAINGSYWSTTDIANHDTAYAYSQVGHLPLTGGTLTGTLNGTATSMTISIADELRTKNGNYLVINAGESHAYATGQTGENVYVNAENGLQVNSSPDNWASVWAGRKTATICNAAGDSYFPGIVDATGYIETTGADTAPAAGASRLSANMLHIDGKEVIDGNDTYIRLNQNADFTSGIYTPGELRVDGTFTANGTFAANGTIVGDGATTISGIETVTIDSTGDITKTSHGNYLYHQSSSYNADQAGGITFSTSSASAGVSGDIWFTYT
jgi:hypothetical protein